MQDKSIERKLQTINNAFKRRSGGRGVGRDYCSISYYFQRRCQRVQKVVIVVVAVDVARATVCAFINREAYLHIHICECMHSCSKHCM